MRRLLSLAFVSAAACGPQVADRVSVMAVDRLSGEVAAHEVELPGFDPATVRGPAAVVLDQGATPSCGTRRKVVGVVMAASPRCAWLFSAYASLERARQFLISAGAEAQAPVLVQASDQSAAAVSWSPQSDTLTLGTGPRGARVAAGLNAGAVARELARRQLRGLFASHPEEAEGIALFLGAAASGDAGYLSLSDAQGDPAGELDLSRPLREPRPADALAGALWAWADASGDLLSAAKAALAASRALDRSAPGDAAFVLSLVAAQLDGAERDQACAIFRARLQGAQIPACP